MHNGKETLRILTTFLILTLAACGFTPIYGTHKDTDSPVAAELNAVAIDNIPDRNGQLLRNDLIDRFYGKGRPLQRLYNLKIKITLTEQDLGIQANATSTRTLMNMNAAYTLTDVAGKQLITGTGVSIASFNKLDDQYATLAARNDAIQRTINEVSEQITGRVSLYFSERDNKPAP